MSTVHVLPVNDLIDLDAEFAALADDAAEWASTSIEAVFREDGSNGWLVCHHSLDRREEVE